MPFSLKKLFNMKDLDTKRRDLFVANSLLTDAYTAGMITQS